jgi:membrane-associated protease RseP (regulator of RpoE activity)
VIERHRDDGFEATFVVGLPRAEAWARLEQAEPVESGIGTPREGQWWIPGVEGPIDVEEVVPGERVKGTKALQPCKGTSIVVTLEDDETGTRITFVQSGFGPDFPTNRPWLEAGWWAIRADLYAYFATGVSLGRHLRPWAGLGCEVQETPGGLVVTSVPASGPAADLGLQKGDLLVTIGGSPVLTTRDLAIVSRLRNADAHLRDIRYLRDGKVSKAGA